VVIERHPQPASAVVVPVGVRGAGRLWWRPTAATGEERWVAEVAVRVAGRPVCCPGRPLVPSAAGFLRLLLPSGCSVPGLPGTHPPQPRSRRARAPTDPQKMGTGHPQGRGRRAPAGCGVVVWAQTAIRDAAGCSLRPIEVPFRNNRWVLARPGLKTSSIGRKRHRERPLTCRLRPIDDTVRPGARPRPPAASRVGAPPVSTPDDQQPRRRPRPPAAPPVGPCPPARRTRAPAAGIDQPIARRAASGATGAGAIGEDWPGRLRCDGGLLLTTPRAGRSS